MHIDYFINLTKNYLKELDFDLLLFIQLIELNKND